MRQLRISIVSSFLLSLPATALAYPSSIVFSPNGEAKPLGTVGLLAYGAINVSPKVAPGSSWFGIEGGLLPQWKYGESGLSFGGLEVGLDVITPFETSTGTIVKPVLNFKLGAITEGLHTPSVALGLMEIAPTYRPFVVGNSANADPENNIRRMRRESFRITAEGVRMRGQAIPSYLASREPQFFRVPDRR